VIAVHHTDDDTFFQTKKQGEIPWRKVPGFKAYKFYLRNLSWGIWII